MYIRLRTRNALANWTCGVCGEVFERAACGGELVENDAALNPDDVVATTGHICEVCRLCLAGGKKGLVTTLRKRAQDIRDHISRTDSEKEAADLEKRAAEYSKRADNLNAMTAPVPTMEDLKKVDIFIPGNEEISIPGEGQPWCNRDNDLLWSED